MAFGYCSSLTSVTIPSSLTSIGDYVFYGCSKLTSITFEGNPPSAYSNSFPTSNTNLVGYYLPDNATAWEAVITDGKWNGITMEKYVLETIVTYSDGSTKSFLIEGEIVGRSDSPYYTTQIDNVQNAKEIRIGKAVTSIGHDTFSDCTSLISVTIPSTVTTIGTYAFYNCSKLTSITIPDTVTSIGGYVFYNCSSLTSITIPEGVTSIGGNLFNGCTNLISVVIPSTVTTIGARAFYICKSLTSITIPDGVTSIGEWAFYNCSTLTSIIIPESVTSIYSYAFNGCKLTSITFEGKTQSQVKAMTHYDWAISVGTPIICTDGSFTAT
jgi:hypothetical protein